MDDARSRLATLSDGSSTYNLVLADPSDTRVAPYERRYVDLQAEEPVRAWRVDDWSGGEGRTWWDSDLRAYDTSNNVRPLDSVLNQGLVLGWLETATDDNAAATFTDADIFGIVQGSLWCGLANNLYEWDSSADNWKAGVATGASGSAIQSIADGHDTWIYTTHANGTVRRSKSGSNEAWMTSGGDTRMALVDFGGLLFMLVKNDLYQIDKTQAAGHALSAHTQKGDSSDGNSVTWLGWVRQATLSVSDKGPIWVESLINGESFVHEYEVATDTDTIIGKLPLGALPFSIAHSNGFVFVSYRYGGTYSTNDLGADAHIAYMRGNQRGKIGPLRNNTSGAALTGPLFAGTIGPRLMYYWRQSLFGYNMRAGAIEEQARSSTLGNVVNNAIAFNQEVFIADNSSDEVHRFQPSLYTTVANATLNSGWHDFGRPESNKVIHDVTAIFDPLPANTSIDLGYATDGNTTFTAVSDAEDTDGATSKTWTLTSGSTTVSGRTFAYQLKPKTTSSSATPTIRQVIVRSSVLERRIRWDLLVELDVKQAVEGHTADSWDTLSDLRATMATPKAWTFASRWEMGPDDAAESNDVFVSDMVLADAEGRYARVVLTSVATV